MKALNKHKKIKISLLILILLLITSTISLFLIYRPRHLSYYINSNSDSFNKIEIVNYDETIVNIQNNKEKNFLDELLAVKVIPSHLFIQKVVSSYTINVYYHDVIYQVNNYYIYDGNCRTYYNCQNTDDIYNLVYKYTGGLI